MMEMQDVEERRECVRTQRLNDLFVQQVVNSRPAFLAAKPDHD